MSAMTSRERVRKALAFDYPDRPPISHAILPSALLRYGSALRAVLAGVEEDFGWDFLPDLPLEKFPPYYRKGRNRDGFGVVWECSNDGEYGLPVEKPLADWSRFVDYKWPDFEVNPPVYRLYSGNMVGKDPRWYARGGWITFFETMQELRGFEDLLADIALGEDAAIALRDGLLAHNLRLIDKFLKLDYDGIHFADDWGTQTALMINPELWRAFFRPCYKVMFDRVLAAGKDVHFHSDGYITDILPDLIDLGVSVVNCQSNCMGNEELGLRFKGRICFRTDLDRQKVMTYGGPADVRKHIGEVFHALGSEKGGIIACGEIGRDTPLDNIKAMYETFMEFRF
ncbi:MAG: uroporphyrinogen decarboxylase family protein [Rectinemataceae bacterium]